MKKLNIINKDGIFYFDGEIERTTREHKTIEVGGTIYSDFDYVKTIINPSEMIDDVFHYVMEYKFEIVDFNLSNGFA